MIVMRMMAATRTTIETCLEIDPEITKEERKHLKRALDSDSKGDTLLTTKEACALLECHPMTLSRYEKRGLLEPKRRSKRHLRWRKDDILDLLHNGIQAA